MDHPIASELGELVGASANLPNASVELGRVDLMPRELHSILQRVRTTPAVRAQHTDDLINQRGQGQHRVGQYTDARAHYLLAGSGFDAEQVLSDIAYIRASQPKERNAAATAVKHKRKNTPLAGAPIDSLVAATVNDFEARLASELSSDWKQRKRQIYEMLGVFAPGGSDKRGVAEGNGSSSVYGKKPLPISSWSGRQGKSDGSANETRAGQIGEADVSWVKWGAHQNNRVGLQILGEPEPLPDPHMAAGSGDRSVVITWQRIKDFAEVISEFNASRARPLAYPLIKKLSDLSRKHDPGASSQLVDMWDLLYLITKQPSTSRSKDYLQAKQCLELQYRDYIDSEISTHRNEAKLGGIPSAYAKIKAFVQLKHTSKTGQWDESLSLINKTPIWAHMYYLVRAGYLKEALQVVLERNDIFELIGSTFASVFKAYVQSPDNVLSPQYAELVYSEYAQSLSSGDPYKQALYKILGRCDLQRRSLPQVATTTEDWLWLQLTLVRPAETAEFATDRFDIGDLQNSVLRIGSQYFDPDGSNPGKWFSVLMLVGLYSQAIEHLLAASSQDSWTEICAVHYTIALAYHKFDLGTLKYAEVIGHYTRFFRQAIPSSAVDYLATIAMPKGANHETECYEALQELVLETGHFSELLGDVDPATDRSYPGAIERVMELIGLHDKRSYLIKIANEAAVKADIDGRTLDAILLYRLANLPEKVLTMVNSTLAQTLSSVPVGQPISSAPALGSVPGSGEPLDILQLSHNLMRLNSIKKAKPEARNTTLVLLSIADSLNLLADKQYERCLDQLGKTGLMVLSPDADVTTIREVAQQFVRHDDSIARVVPSVLMAIMTCCIKICESLRTSDNPAGAALIGQYRHVASNCMVYAGLIQYRMSREVFSHLTKLESLL